MTPEEVAEGRTFPAISRIREVSHNVACEVIKVALDHGLNTRLKAEDFATDEALQAHVASKMYDPTYVPLVDPAR